MIVSDAEDEFLQQGPLTAWTCSHCTVENEATYLACDCCGQERPSGQIATNGVSITNQPLPQPPQQQQQQRLSHLDSQPSQQYAAPIIENGSGTWTCSACTFVNSRISLDCDVCGTPGIAVEAVDLHPSGAHQHRQHRQRQHEEDLEEDLSDSFPPPALHIPISYNFNNRNDHKDSSQNVYDLDCGCCGPFKEIKEAARVSVVTLPSAPSLLCLLRHFSCPANATTSGIAISSTAGTSSRHFNDGKNSNTNTCALKLSGRDLKALLGAKVAAAIERGFYAAAVAAASNGTRGTHLPKIDDTRGAAFFSS